MMMIHDTICGGGSRVMVGIVESRQPDLLLNVILFDLYICVAVTGQYVGYVK